MQTFNQTILNGMIEKVIALLEKSSYADALAIQRLRATPFTINYRMRTKGGCCKYRRQAYTKQAYDISIEIGHDFCMRATQEEVQNTVSHELAHAYQVLLTNDTDHGWMWQSIHRAMGGTAERCHQVEVQKNRVLRHKIVDTRNGKTYTISTRKWNQIRYIAEGNHLRFKLQESFVAGQPQTAAATA
jgi:predicted SprT family Zn-dependent metalloprotease